MNPLSCLIILPLAFTQMPVQDAPQIALPVDTLNEPAEEPVDRQPLLDATLIDELVDRARLSLAEDRFPEAVELYTEVSDRLPNDQRFQYNLGVASYRSGDLESAARCFERAATTGDPSLTQSALFNRGTVSYRRALDAVQEAQNQQGQQRADGGAVDPALLDDPIQALEQAISHYRDAITASADNRDARRNAELAHRLMKALEQEQEEQEQDQQQQDEQQQDEQQQDQQQQDEQQQDEQQQDEQQQDEQQQDEQQQDEQQQDQEQQDPQQQDEQQQDQEQQDPQQQDPQQQDQQQQDQQQQDGQPQDEQPQDEQQQDEQPQDQEPQDQKPQDQEPQDQKPQDQKPQEDTKAQAAESSGSSAEQPVRMTEEQAEALLQMIRDREKQRRQVLAEREAREAARRYRPVEKDW